MAHLTSEQLLIWDAVAGFLLHVEEVVNKLVLEMLSANQKGADKRLSAALETLVVRIVNKVVNPLEFIN